MPGSDRQQRGARASAQHRGLLLSCLAALHAAIVRPLVNWWSYSVLGALEESIRSLIRESLALTQRSINGLSAWALSGAMKPASSAAAACGP